MGARAKRFEDLIAWQKARVLVGEVLTLTRGPLRRDFAMADQMTRAARSVMANIAEGFDRSGPKEFHKGLSIAKGSCAELRSDLYVLLDAGCIDRDHFDRLQALAIEVAKVIAGLRAAVARNIEVQEKH